MPGSMREAFVTGLGATRVEEILSEEYSQTVRWQKLGVICFIIPIDARIKEVIPRNSSKKYVVQLRIGEIFLNVHIFGLGYSPMFKVAQGAKIFGKAMVLHKKTPGGRQFTEIEINCQNPQHTNKTLALSPSLPNKPHELGINFFFKTKQKPAVLIYYTRPK